MLGRPNGSRRGADHTVVLETTGELQWPKYPTDQTEKQATISDMLLWSRVRGRDEKLSLDEGGHSP